MLWTRGNLTRTWGVHDTGITTHPAAGWNPGPLLRGGPISILLPPAKIEMDPSDPRTWQRPVRYTT